MHGRQLGTLVYRIGGGITVRQNQTRRSGKSGPSRLVTGKAVHSIETWKPRRHSHHRVFPQTVRQVHLDQRRRIALVIGKVICADPHRAGRSFCAVKAVCVPLPEPSRPSKIISLPLLLRLLFQLGIFLTHRSLLPAAHPSLRAGTGQAARSRSRKNMRCQGQHQPQHLIRHGANFPLARLQQRRLKKFKRLRQFIVMTILVSQALGSTKRASSLACLPALARAAFSSRPWAHQPAGVGLFQRLHQFQIFPGIGVHRLHELRLCLRMASISGGMTYRKSSRRT